MVFTDPVRIPDGRTRRSLLGLAAGVAAAGALGGCGPLGSQPEWYPPDPLTELYLATIALADQYDAAISEHSGLSTRLSPLRDAHRTHAVAMAHELALPAPDPHATRTPGSSVAAPQKETTALAALLAAERAAAAAAMDACVAAPWWRTQLLGSVAACRASHVEVLTP